MRPILALAFCFLLAGDGPAQCRSCGGGFVSQLAAQTEPVVVNEQVSIEGREFGYWRLGRGGYQYRYVDGQVVGAYDPDLKLWWPLIDGEYRRDLAIPYDRARAQDRRNQGLELDKLAHQERISIGGKPVATAEASALIGQDVPAFSRMARVTAVVRDPAWRQRIERDFAAAPELARYKGQVLFDVYSPEHWHLAPFSLERSPEFQRSGLAILIQGPPDKSERSKPYALWTYAGPAAVAAAIEGLRQPAPTYDPTHIAPVPGPLSLGRVPWGVLAIAGAFVVIMALWVFRKR